MQIIVEFNSREGAELFTVGVESDLPTENIQLSQGPRVDLALLNYARPKPSS